jgi:hypothetical protein
LKIIRRGAAESFKIFQRVFDFFININRNVAVQWKNTKIATFLPISAGQFYLLSYCGWQIFRHFPAAFLFAQRLSNILWASPSGFSVPFWQCPTSVQQLSRIFPGGCGLKHGNFHPFSLKGMFLLIFIELKSKEHF